MLNKTVQLIRSLREKKQRDTLGLFVVEGEKVVAELVAAGYRFEEIYATDAWAGARTDSVSAAEMGRISHFPTPSPVLAMGKIRRETLEQGILAKGLTLVLDGVQDPGNVGTLLRIADWYALERAVLSPACADLHSQKVIQSSMGSFARVKTFVADLPKALQAVAVPVVGCALEGKDVHALEPVHNAVIVIGNEGRGISPEVRSRITTWVTIPRYGSAESLNAAVAGAIVCDNLRRRLGTA